MQRSFVILSVLTVLFAIPRGGTAEDRETTRLETLRASAADFSVGVAAQRRGDFDIAARAYETAITRDPAFVEAMVNLARIHISRGDFAAAHRWLDRAEATRPEYPEIYATRGIAALEQADPDGALQALTLAVERTPRDPQVLSNLGAALLRKGLVAEALSRLQESLRLDAKSREATFNLALALDHSGDTGGALYYYKRFLDLSAPSDPLRSSVNGRIAMLDPQAPVTANADLKNHLPLPARDVSGLETDKPVPLAPQH